jgi:hypothetical protein
LPFSKKDIHRVRDLCKSNVVESREFLEPGWKNFGGEGLLGLRTEPRQHWTRRTLRLRTGRAYKPRLAGLRMGIGSLVELTAASFIHPENTLKLELP